MKLQADIATFTRRWHALEKSLGPKGGLVIDFDLAPRDLAAADLPPYAGREDALDVLTELQAQVELAEGLHNRCFLAHHLAGSEAYLRALLGERAPFSAYLQATMGIAPWQSDPRDIEARREALQAELSRLRIPWGPDGYAAMRARLGRTDLQGFEAELRDHAQGLVAQVRARVPAAPAPTYRIEVVEEDAYWANWIDGSVEEGVTLKVNRHPRIEYVQSSPLQLAAHEIAGHAVHVGCLRASATVDPCTLALAVHACEAFQMEGLAQAMIHYLHPEGLPKEVALLERYRDYASDVLNDAQLRVEAGEPIDLVCADAIAASPLTKALSIRSSLRDRSRDPLFRTYIPVYAPARHTFLRALELSPEARDAFLAAVLTGLWTPGQIDRLLEGEDPAVVRAS